MVFVNAKNNLEKFGFMNIKQMEKVGSSDDVKIAVEFGRLGQVGSDGGWRGQRRYIIQKGDDPNKIISPVLQDIPKADMGDWRHLVDFVNWAREAAPAEHYMLIGWDHGSGWLLRLLALLGSHFQESELRPFLSALYSNPGETGLLQLLPRSIPLQYEREALRLISLLSRSNGGILPMGISYDDETGNHISTLDLGRALEAIGKLDIYASDACLMQMAEVIYQVMKYAGFVVGSEETEPGDGYTYNTFLAPIVVNPLLAPRAVAEIAVKAYVEHYAGTGQGVTQSAVDTAAFGQLPALLNDWTKLVMAANETELVKSALGRVQSFYYSDNKDLLHFIKLIDAGTRNEGVRSKGAELENFLAKGITSNGTLGSGYANALGLAIYLPRWSYSNAYDELAWAKDGNWVNFVRWVQAIR